MIFGNLETTDLSEIGHAGVRRALEYARTHDLMQLAPGRNEIDGDDLFVNVACYETRAFEDCRFEAHKKYIDVQLMVEGVERIDSQFVGELASEPFDEAADNAFLNGEAAASVTLSAGTFAAYFPNDGHKPGIAVGESASVRKCIFKVAVTQA